jgi:hypothetical protein
MSRTFTNVDDRVLCDVIAQARHRLVFVAPGISYFSLRERGANIPPAWLDRSRRSRKSREKELGGLLQAAKLDAANQIREWELCYRKECSYHGLRARTLAGWIMR